MEILRSISMYCELKGMLFLIIGGHAINAFGISRHTADIDIMVPGKDKSQWQELMQKLKYKPGQDDSRFSRYQPINLDNWPIDIMYVNEETFNALYEDSMKQTFGDAEAQVVSIEHLILLKLHALKTYQEHRFVKDYTDLTGLISKTKTDITSELFKEKCLKYGSEDIYERLRKDVVQKN